MRLLRYLILFVIALTAVTFAVANRHLVPFVLDPIAGPESSLSFDAPLFLFLFGALLTGFLIGAFATWFSQSRWRNAARQRSREVSELRKENERVTRHLRVMERASQVRAFATKADVENRPMIH